MSDRLDDNSVKAAFGKIGEALREGDDAKGAAEREAADKALMKSGLAIVCDLVLTLHDIRDALVRIADRAGRDGSLR